MSQEQKKLDAETLSNFFKRDDVFIDIDEIYQITFKEEISEKKRNLFLNFMIKNHRDLLLEFTEKPRIACNKVEDLRGFVERSCEDFCAELLNYNQKKLHEYEKIFQSTNKIIEQINSVLNHSQSKKEKNFAENPLSSDEFQKIDQSIGKLKQISPYDDQSEIIIQALYKSLLELNSNI